MQYTLFCYLNFCENQISTFTDLINDIFLLLLIHYLLSIYHADQFVIIWQCHGQGGGSNTGSSNLSYDSHLWSLKPLITQKKREASSALHVARKEGLTYCIPNI